MAMNNNRRDLWNHMAAEHNVHLLESEQDEIERIVLDGYRKEQSRVLAIIGGLAILFLIGFLALLLLSLKHRTRNTHMIEVGFYLPANKDICTHGGHGTLA